VAYFKQAFMLQLAIDLNDGIGIDDQRFGQTANTWQLIPGRNGAGLDGMTNLFLDLNVDGNTGGRIWFTKHCAT